METNTQSAVDEIETGVSRGTAVRVQGVIFKPFPTNADAKEAEKPPTKQPTPTQSATAPVRTTPARTAAPTPGAPTTKDPEATFVTGEWLLPEDVPPEDVKKAIADILGKEEGDVDVTVTPNADGTATAAVSVKKSGDEDLVADLANDDFNKELATGLQFEAGSVQTSKAPKEEAPQSSGEEEPKSNTTVIIVVICVVGAVILIALVAIVAMRRNGDRDSFTTTGSLAKMEFNNPVYDSNVQAAAAPSGGADPFYASLRRKASVRLDNAAQADAEFEA